jgi:hypothetical protein
MIRNSDVNRALKTVLKMNYNFIPVGPPSIVITPEKVEWYLAVQFRNDPKKQWHPRILIYFPKKEHIVILNQIGDIFPVKLKLETLMTMAAIKAIDPNPNFKPTSK